MKTRIMRISFKVGSINYSHIVYYNEVFINFIVPPSNINFLGFDVFNNIGCTRDNPSELGFSSHLHDICHLLVSFRFKS